MASPTRRLKRQRKIKLRRSGQSRKRHERSKGTTPKFAIHQDAESK